MQKSKKRLRIVTGFGWEMAHGAVTRRPPISLDKMVPCIGGYTYAVGVGICPSFKDHSLSRRPTIRKYFHRCLEQRGQ
jgi:hypothetical protein